MKCQQINNSGPNSSSSYAHIHDTALLPVCSARRRSRTHTPSPSSRSSAPVTHPHACLTSSHHHNRDHAPLRAGPAQELHAAARRGAPMSDCRLSVCMHGTARAPRLPPRRLPGVRALLLLRLPAAVAPWRVHRGARGRRACTWIADVSWHDGLDAGQALPAVQHGHCQGERRRM